MSLQNLATNAPTEDANSQENKKREKRRGGDVKETGWKKRRKGKMLK